MLPAECAEQQEAAHFAPLAFSMPMMRSAGVPQAGERQTTGTDIAVACGCRASDSNRRTSSQAGRPACACTLLLPTTTQRWPFSMRPPCGEKPPHNAQPHGHRCWSFLLLQSAAKHARAGAAGGAARTHDEEATNPPTHHHPHNTAARRAGPPSGACASSNNKRHR